MNFVLLLALFVLAVEGKVYFKETFDKGWEKRWTESTKWKSASELGSWKASAGEWYAKRADKALLDEPLNNLDKDLIIQYSVKMETPIECGGTYIKLLGKGFDQESFGGDTPYEIIRLEFLKPEKIKDPEAKKPDDWVEEEFLPDPNDTKPDDYEDVPEKIPDPEAEKPVDWDDEDDGEWEPPMIENPDFLGEWIPKMIKNPAYKGRWVHPMIPNPEFVPDDKLYHRCKECTGIGFELWQVKAGSIFDDIIVSDSLEEVEEFFNETYKKKAGKEKDMHAEKQEEKKRKAEQERARAEEARRAAEEAEDDMEEVDIDNDDEEDQEISEIRSEL
eukprot:g2724.t1